MNRPTKDRKGILLPFLDLLKYGGKVRDFEDLFDHALKHESVARLMKIKDLFDYSNCGEVVVYGDSNADPSGRFFTFLNGFCNNEIQLVRDRRYFLLNVYIFESEAHSSTSW